MPFLDRNFFEILGSQAVSLAGGIVAGTLLAVYTDQLLLLPGIFIMLPGFLEMRGNISGSFSSRISSGLFLGIIRARSPSRKIIRGNLAASFILATAVSLLLGIIAFVFSFFIGGVVFPEIIILPLIAGVLANAIEIPLTLFATIYLYRKGHDPNNIMGPFITSTGDVISVLSLLLSMVILT